MSTQSDHRDSSPMGIGLITIFMVLMVLCLAILATLTLSTARADLLLSRVNAETTTAYYEADAEAAELFAQFVAGGADGMEATIPMTEHQSLYVKFGRDADGAAVILVWKTASVTDESDWGDFELPVWVG